VQETPPVAAGPLTVPAPAPAPLPAGPAVTLLLPLDAPEFRAAADALRLGFLAAMTTEGSKLEIVVRRTDASDDRVLEGYEAAAAGGTRAIVGPMTRSAVGALIRSGRVTVPTVALNRPEDNLPLPRGLYVFSLGADAEARHVARQAWADTMQLAGVVSTRTAVDRRSRDAFVDEWLQLGGKITDILEVAPGADPVQLREALDRNPPHFVFLAAGGERARFLRPFLGSQMPVYATSQVYTTEDPLKNFDLNGVRFTEMPWLVRPQDPVVARYPRPPGMDVDSARFYALGIDAYGIAARLLGGERAFEFDGVTGRIVVTTTGIVDRRPIAATVRDGKSIAAE